MCLIIKSEHGGVFPKWEQGSKLTYKVHFDKRDFDEIHFFGDQTEPNGSDYTLYSHPDIIGHSVKNPKETINILYSICK